MEEFLLYKKQKEKTLKGQPFAERKDGRGSDRISEDQAPYNNWETQIKGRPNSYRRGSGDDSRKKGM